ncbi:MAG TPA: hypothetical protein VFX79_02810 [Candidatus Saccharimonadales bacterium]|nr:hypothetical protein [Candidatus Saccharimonadales bacterium]
MDDDSSPQNKNKTGNQPVQTDSPSYNQYIDADYQKKQKKKKLLVIFGSALAALVIVSAAIILAVLATSSQDNSTNSAQDNVAIAESCDDETCFELHLRECSPAEYTFEEEGISKVEYKITGAAEIGCLVEVAYLESEYLPEAEGKNMTCDFDNTIDLQSAVQNVFDYPDDYDCEGELVGVFEDSSEQL